MLYSAELTRQNRGLETAALLFFVFTDESFLLNAGLLTGEVAEVEDAGSADLTDLVDFDAVNEGGSEGENPLNTDSAGNLADRKGPGILILSLNLDNDASELLKTFLIAFLDFIGYGDGITGLELRERFSFAFLESVFCNLN